MSARLAQRTASRLALFSLLALVLVWPVLGDAARANEFRDAQVLMAYEHAAVDTVKRFGELPLWNPYYCGGLDGLGAPQSRFGSPTFFVSLLFGPERAEIVLVFLLAVLGMEGVFRWLRARALSPLAAALVAPVFALSGHFSVAYYRGWTSFFGFELVPWILLGVTLAARGRARGLVVASTAFAVVLGFGGTFAAPLVAVACVIEGVRTVHERAPPERPRALVMLAATASFMGALSMLRLWPLAETLASTPRIMAGAPGHGPLAILQALGGSLVVKGGDVQRAGRFFVGVSFLLLVLLGAATRKSLRPLLVLMVLLWLAAGYARTPSLFALLRELPVFSALRYPERFLWLAILFACEPAAHALEDVPLLGEAQRWRTWSRAVLGAMLAATLFGEIAAFARAGQERTLGARSPAPGQDFRQARGNRWLATHAQALGTGSLSCWETHPVFMSPLLRADLPAEEYAADPAGVVRRRSWSPNRVTLEVRLPSPGRVLVNQNWHPGWRASVGRVVPEQGLLAVEMPEGEHVVELSYRPWAVIGGATVSAVAILALGIVCVRSRSGRKPFTRGSRAATLALALAPWGAFFAVRARTPEPPWPQLAPRNANGTPALVESVPAGTERVDARFSMPVQLDAIRVESPEPRGPLRVDAYVRRTGPLSRAATMFVHVQRREGGDEAAPEKDQSTFLNADRQVLAGSFFVSDAPKNALVHDAFGVALDRAAKGTWDVWISFGHVVGRGARAKLVNNVSQPVEQDRIRVGTFRVR